MKPNKHGCRVSGDVCMIHESPLICKHGCEDVLPHSGCKDYDEWLKDIKEKAWKYEELSK